MATDKKKAIPRVLFYAVSVVILVGLFSLPAVPQQGELQPEDAIRRIRDQTTDATRKFPKLITSGSCEGKYERIPENILRIPRDALDLLDKVDPAAWNTAVQKSRGELDALQASLVAQQKTLENVKEGQKAACLEWLRREYGSKVGSTTVIPLGDRNVSITPTLFGTFISEKPTLISPPNEEPQVRVIFKSAVFEDERLTPNIELSPRSPISPISGLSVLPLDVVGSGRQHPFSNDQREPIRPTSEIRWTWKLKAEPGFERGKIYLWINAVRVEGDKATDPPLLAAEIPVEIEKRPTEPPWWVKNLATIIAAILGIIGGLCSAYFAHWLKIRKET